jgi:hypothetical protein
MSQPLIFLRNLLIFPGTYLYHVHEKLRPSNFPSLSLKGHLSLSIQQFSYLMSYSVVEELHFFSNCGT